MNQVNRMKKWYDIFVNCNWVVTRWQIRIDCNCISTDHYRKQSWSVTFDIRGNSVNQSSHKSTQSSRIVPDIYFLALSKLELSRCVLVKQPDIKFHENPPVGIEIFPCGQKDRRDEANSHFSKLWERV